MRNYRDLQFWSKAHNLALELYRASRGFPCEDNVNTDGKFTKY